MNSTKTKGMQIIGYSDSPEVTAKAFELGCDLVFTYNVDDVTEPTKTIYCITGADYVNNRKDALKHGYLNRLGVPMEELKDEFPIAINSTLYMENFVKRLELLHEYTRWPHGIHIGGSHNLIEHCFPKNRMTSSGYWCYGFEETHYKDPNITLSKYQVKVWEETTNELIQEAEKLFPSLKLITTAFRCPTPTITKGNSSMLLNGAEIWYMFKRLSKIHPHWRNVFFNIFQIEKNKEAKAERFMDIKANISAYDLRGHMISNCMGVSSLFGRSRHLTRLTEDAHGVGTPYQAYMTNCHGGILMDIRSSTPDDVIKDKIHSIKRLPI